MNVGVAKGSSTPKLTPLRNILLTPNRVMTTTRPTPRGLVVNRESVLSLTTHVVQTPRHSSCAVLGPAPAAGGAPHQLQRMRQTAELWIAGEISRSVNLCLQCAFTRTIICKSAPWVVLARAGMIIITTTERVGSESELGELSLTPHRLLSPRITRRETSRHGVGVLLKEQRLNAREHCALRTQVSRSCMLPPRVSLN